MAVIFHLWPAWFGFSQPTPGQDKTKTLISLISAEQAPITLDLGLVDLGLPLCYLLMICFLVTALFPGCADIDES